jgi:hypothetical protein
VAPHVALIVWVVHEGGQHLVAGVRRDHGSLEHAVELPRAISRLADVGGYGEAGHGDHQRHVNASGGDGERATAFLGVHDHDQDEDRYAKAVEEQRQGQGDPVGPDTRALILSALLLLFRQPDQPLVEVEAEGDQEDQLHNDEQRAAELERPAGQVHEGLRREEEHRHDERDKQHKLDAHAAVLDLRARVRRVLDTDDAKCDDDVEEEGTRHDAVHGESAHQLGRDFIFIGQTAKPNLLERVLDDPRRPVCEEEERK